MTDSPLSQYLRLLRTSHNYKQEDLAKSLGITRANYSHYENARLIPPTDILYKISNFYSIPLDDLFKLTVMSIEDRKGEAASVKPSAKPKAGSGSKDINPDFERMLKTFLSECSDMTDKELNKWATVEDREILFHYHSLSDQNKRNILYFLRILSIMDGMKK